MNVEEFFNLFIKELESKPTLWSYYKYHTDSKSFEFRKAYFCQRLAYIADKIIKPEGLSWDIGCGYGTTAIFLALNGYKVHGTTLEFYFKEIPERIKYWSQFGDVSGFTFDYEDIFDPALKSVKYDYIIVQDTLHHLEPLQEALNIVSNHLALDGEIVAIEENGNNIIQSLKLFKQRGNKRIIEFYDERLKKTILLGNENIRSIQTWQNEMNKQGLSIDMTSVQYVRAYPPFLFNKFGYEKSILREQKLWKQNKWMKEYFFFGINFIATHIDSISKSTAHSPAANHTLNH
ncbi:MAG: class I SAM-dependent methyltransferase [Bacteroidia bacterium]